MILLITNGECADICFSDRDKVKRPTIHESAKVLTKVKAVAEYDVREMFSLLCRYDLSSLKILGTVGEPINPEAWHWYHEAVGQGRCPVVDTFWQTETVSGPFSLQPYRDKTAGVNGDVNYIICFTSCYN